MQQRRPQRGPLKAGLAVTLLGIVAYGCIGLSPAASTEPTATTAAVVPGQSGPGPQTTVDVTAGPLKTKKPKRTQPPGTSTTSTDEPTTQPTDTSAPTDQPTEPPTAPPSAAGSGLHLRSFFLASLIIIKQKLDYQAAAKYGEANLSNGFAPDPYSVGTTSGGPVDVSYLGGSCSGFASTAPDLRVNFGGGGSALLRIYYEAANGDAAMVINDPYGNFYCVDDSFGTVNPTIDFNNPAGGSYDIWIASYASSANISGTLYMTENSGNHP
jgi:hypothetical protein